jgi:large subunit ribosomal protein L17
MRHKNDVKRLGRSHSHRKAMFGNMVTSLFLHERIVTTKQKGKELKKITDRLISRAKRNLELSASDADAAKKLHNKREVMRVIKDRDVVKKLFEDIAQRYAGRNGGYTRHFLLGMRAGDAAEMAIVELVERRVKAAPATDETKDAKAAKKEKKEKVKAKEKKDIKEKKEKKEKKDKVVK